MKSWFVFFALVASVSWGATTPAWNIAPQDISGNTIDAEFLKQNLVTLVYIIDEDFTRGGERYDSFKAITKAFSRTVPASKSIIVARTYQDEGTFATELENHVGPVFRDLATYLRSKIRKDELTDAEEKERALELTTQKIRDAVHFVMDNDLAISKKFGVAALPEDVPFRVLVFDNQARLVSAPTEIR